ncbi:TonB-dependent receptor [soil metagenome]
MKLLLLVLFFVFTSSVHAQQKFILKGSVINENGISVPNAVVSFYYIGSADTLKTTADKIGNFTLKNISAKPYGIKIAASGFNLFEKIYDYSTSFVSERSEIIIMTVNSTVLQTVVVETPKVLIREDTVTYKIDSTMYRQNDNVESVLKKLPGVQVNNSGDVTAQGKAVTKVKVNGKEFFGGDVKTATRELRADMVENVQVIDDYGDQSAFTGIKDGEPTKTLNIQLKKDRNKGVFGNGTIGAGTEGRYAASVSIHRFNNEEQISLLGNLNNTNSNLFSFPAGASGSGGMRIVMGGRGGDPSGNSQGVTGDASNQTNNNSNPGVAVTKSLGLNYRNDWGTKFSTYGSYSYSDKNSDILTNSSTLNVFQTSTNINNQNSIQNNIVDNHRANWNFEFKPDSSNFIKFSPSISYRKTRSKAFTEFESFKDDTVRNNSGSSNGVTSATAPNFSGSIVFNHRFRNRARTLSIGGTAGNSSTEQDDNDINLNTYYRPDGSQFSKNLFQDIVQDNTNRNLGFKVSYNEPLSKKYYVEMNYNYSNSLLKNDKETFDVDQVNGSKKYVDSLSNIYKNNYISHRFGINLRAAQKKFNYTVGFAVQPSTLKSNQVSKQSSYTQQLFNYYPVVRFAYNFSRSRSFNLNYSGSTSQPTYTQLQPVYDYSNPLFPVIGNPDIKPEFTNNFSSRYNNFNFIKGDVFMANLSISVTQNKIVTNTINKGFGIQETRYLNANGYFTANLFYLWTKPFNNRKYVFSALGFGNYTNNISFINSEKNIGTNTIVSQKLSAEVNPVKWLETSTSVSFAVNTTKYSLQDQLSSTTKARTISNSARLFFGKGWILSYELDKTLNSGYSNQINSDPFIINSTLEKQLLAKKNASFKLQGFDLLNENTNVYRTVSGNAITDSRSNRLGRYFMLSFIYRINKFNTQNQGRYMGAGTRVIGF